MTHRKQIGGKGLNSGIRGGLWEVKHYKAMGDAVWLFGWLVHRQTTEKNGEGLVLRGMPLTYADISNDTGWPERTIRRWMATLRFQGYVSVKHGCYSKMILRVLNAKKFSSKQLQFDPDLPHSSRPDVAETSRPTLADMGTKSGRLKERAEFEQKLLRSGSTAAASHSLNPWKALGDDLPMGSPRFQRIFEHYFATRNGNSLSEAMERAIQRAHKEHAAVPPKFYEAKRVVERREAEELAVCSVSMIPELEAEPWAK